MTFELYPFQNEDVSKYKIQPAALEGSEMGVGKTHIAIATDQLWYKQAKVKFPTLIVAPLNTFDSWVEKYEMQDPDANVFVIDRKNRDAFVKAIKARQADVFLCHWDALRLIVDDLQTVTFNTVIADEVHRASNRKAKATKALKKIKTYHKLGLSGSASGDKPDGLWSILNWLYPKNFPSYWRFRQEYCVEEMTFAGRGAYKKIVGVKNKEQLQALIAPFYSRHLKREQCCEHHLEGVMSWLPDKTYQNIWVDLSPTQRKFYEQMRTEMVAWVGKHEDSPLVASVVVAQMVRLSQMALATPEFEGDKIKLKLPSSKLDALKEYIEDTEGKQLVVFSASKQICYLAQEFLKQADITSEVLSGDTPQGQREGMVKRFNEGKFQIFIGVIQAAAEGIDGLQHSTDTAIFLDRAWSTVKNSQAEDRLHRGGQKNTVTIIDIMARNTLDFGRKQRLETKWSLIKEMLGDPAKAQMKILKEE